MSAAVDRGEAMTGGACMDLAPQVVDKYFFADQQTDAFNHYTARAICGRCAVRAACLYDAVASEAVFADSVHMVRGGEPGTLIQTLRRRHFLQGLSVAQVIKPILEQQEQFIRTPGDFQRLRQGQFPDAELVEYAKGQL